MIRAGNIFGIYVIPIILISTSTLRSQGYQLEFQSPEYTTIDPYGPYSLDLIYTHNRLDMEGDGIPELILRGSYMDSIVVYDGFSHILKWSYGPIDAFIGFFDIDGDGLREAVSQSWDFRVDVIDWETNTIEFSLLDIYNYGVFVYDIDGDNKPEIIAQVGRQGSTHVEVWGDGETTASASTALEPHLFKLKQNYPNPFNPRTIIEYQVQNSEPVKIEVFNIKGQWINTLVDEFKPMGEYSVVWDGTDNRGKRVTSGQYFYVLEVGGFKSSRKMILLK